MSGISSPAISNTGDEAPPTNVTLNASISLTYDGENNLTQIQQVINSVTYRRILTYSGGVLMTISAWTQV